MKNPPIGTTIWVKGFKATTTELADKFDRIAFKYDIKNSITVMKYLYDGIYFKKPSRMDLLLDEYDQVTRKGGMPIERALYHALRLWQGNLPKMDHYFHKAFRQCDVIEDHPQAAPGKGGHSDMVVYNLLDAADVFWALFEIYKPGKRLPERGFDMRAHRRNRPQFRD